MNVYVSDINRWIFQFLSINSFQNKFDQLWEHLKGSVGIYEIYETKLDHSSPQGYHSSFRLDCNKKGGRILLYFRDDIPAKVLSHDFPSSERFFMEIILHKRMAN